MSELPAPGTFQATLTLEPTTLGELAGRLPCGLLTTPGELTSYAFHPPTMGVQRRLGAVVGKESLAKAPGRLAAYWLATALRELNGQPMTGKADEDALRVASLPIGDVLTLLFAWQAAAHPKGMLLEGNACGSCGHDFAAVRVRLEDLAIRRVPGDAGPGNRPSAVVVLDHELPWPRGKTSRVFVVKPAAWIDSFWKLTAEGWRNPVLMRLAVLRAGIAGTPELPLPLPDDVLDELWPDDADLLDAALEAITPGPDLQVAVTCPSPGCGARNVTGLNWTNPGFFSPSSRA